jgi:type II secretory pathway pseudopilin PulG
MSCRRGFTLLEAALTTVIIGVGVVAMTELFGSCTRENAASARMTTAMMLAGQIQELMEDMAFADPVDGYGHFGPEPDEVLENYDDVDDFDGQSFNPPIDATCTTIPELAQYTQVVSVWPVFLDKLSVNTNEKAPEIPKGAYSGAVRVKVRILYRSHAGATAEEIYQTSWIRMDE